MYIQKINKLEYTIYYTRIEIFLEGLMPKIKKNAKPRKKANRKTKPKLPQATKNDKRLFDFMNEKPRSVQIIEDLAFKQVQNAGEKLTLRLIRPK